MAVSPRSESLCVDSCSSTKRLRRSLRSHLAQAHNCSTNVNSPTEEKQIKRKWQRLMSAWMQAKYNEWIFQFFSFPEFLPYTKSYFQSVLEVQIQRQWKKKFLEPNEAQRETSKPPLIHAQVCISASVLTSTTNCANNFILTWWISSLNTLKIWQVQIEEMSETFKIFFIPPNEQIGNIDFVSLVFCTSVRIGDLKFVPV